ncbi:MAG: hypothetical protein R2867_10900 [Caldilineaceae bacterium]
MLWAGTGPSALFRSDDGGRTWQEKRALQAIPSKSTWRFPPRPWTHHVRWIEPDPVVADRLFVGIELGGVMRSLDGGESWEDRKANAQHDCHTVRTHPAAPGFVYEAAGGGFCRKPRRRRHLATGRWGRRYHYLWGLAVDPGNPATLVVSGSPGPGAAHNDQQAAAASIAEATAAAGSCLNRACLMRRAHAPMCWRPTAPNRASFMPPPAAMSTVPPMAVSAGHNYRLSGPMTQRLPRSPQWRWLRHDSSGATLL